MFERSFLENIIVNAPIGIITTDLSGRITFINRVACRIHRQKSPLEIVRKQVSSIARPNPDDFMLVFHSVLNREEEKATVEYSVTSVDEEAFVRATMTMLRDENYRPVGVLIMCEEITEQRILDVTLKKEKHFSESIIETANLIIVGIDADGGIMLFNRAAEEATGYDRREVIGKDWFELFAPEENRADIIELFYGIIDGKTPAYHEHRIITRNSDQRLIGWHTTYLPEFAGHTVGVITIGEDITEKRKLEENLINERERLDIILTSLGAGLILVDKDYEITYANALIEKDFGKCVGKKCYLVFKGTLVALDSKGVCIECPVREVLEKDSRQATAEKKGKDRKGNEFWVQLVATPIQDEKAELVGALQLIVPINERKILEEQLIQAQKMEAVGILAGGIAHDFNNILGAILGYGSLIKTSMNQSDKNYKYIQMIESASRHATDLAERLLSFSRRAKKKAAVLTVNELIINVIALIRSSIGPNTKIKTDLGKNLPSIYGDKTQLEQLIMNIIINARDAMPKGGTIEIKTGKTKLDSEFCKTHLGAHPGQNLVISISDTGMGMSEQTCKHIFEPFFTTKKEGEGTGLGLSIAYSVVRSHKGYIDVESREGEGTEFTIYIPASRKKAEKSAAQKSKAYCGSETVLIVNDEDVDRSLLEDALSSRGYQVLPASSGDEALEIFERSFQEIDLAIIDMIMPDKNGRQTLREMRKIKPEIKAIISTDRSAKGKELEQIKLAGADELLKKPYRFDELLITVKKILGS